MTKDKLVEKIKELLKTDNDLDFLLELKKEELERLVACENVVSDEGLAKAQSKYPLVRSKEELYYFRIFTKHFGARNAVGTVGQWICL